MEGTSGTGLLRIVAFWENLVVSADRCMSGPKPSPALVVVRIFDYNH